MIPIPGLYYDGKSSKAIRTTLEVYSGEARLAGLPGSDLPLSQLRVSARIGNTPRWIHFPDHGKFETTDNNAVDQAFARAGMPSQSGIAHLLESHKRYLLMALLVVIVSSWGFVQYGIPLLAKSAAFALPTETNSMISRGALDLLDRGFFEPSELDQATRDRLQARFVAMTAGQEAGFEYRLEFRKGEDIGANAMALPSGVIVMTDELVQLAENDDELVSILAHEVGHVVQRHGLRNAIQSSMVALVVVMVTGDISSSSSLIAALPTVLVHAQYSQAFEREADRYSLDYLTSNAIPPRHFADIMRRLAKSHGETEGEIPDYLSSHPPSEERARLFEASEGAPAAKNGG